MSLFLIKYIDLDKFSGDRQAAYDLLNSHGRKALLDPLDNVVPLEHPDQCQGDGPRHVISVIDSRVASTVERFADFVKDNGRPLFLKDIQALNQE